MSIMPALKISNNTVQVLAKNLWSKIANYPKGPILKKGRARIFGVPRGGVPVAYLLKSCDPLDRVMIIDDPSQADVIVDDIIDSGQTMRDYAKAYPDIPFYALIDKSEQNHDPIFTGRYIEFPWESSAENEAERLIVRQLQHIGEDPNRPGLTETPKRVVASWQELFAGYREDPKEVLKIFEEPGIVYDQIIAVTNIHFSSMCEHHMLPFSGHASIGYIPGVSEPNNGRVRIVGLSKLARLVDIFSKRLQVQERLTSQIAQTLSDVLAPQAVGCVVKAEHSCMSCRGVKKQNTKTVTSCMYGLFRSSVEARNEFLKLIEG